MLTTVDALLITSFDRPELRLAEWPPISYIESDLITTFDMPSTKAVNDLEEARFYRQQAGRHTRKIRGA